MFCQRLLRGEDVFNYCKIFSLLRLFCKKNRNRVFFFKRIYDSAIQQSHDQKQSLWFWGGDLTFWRGAFEKHTGHMIWTWCLDCSESLRYMLSSQAQQNQGQNQANLQNHRTHESRFYLVVIGLLAHHLLVWSQSKLPNSKMFGFQCSLWPCVESRRKLLKSIYSVNFQRLIIFTKLPYLLRPNRRKKRNEQTFNAK